MKEVYHYNLGSRARLSYIKSKVKSIKKDNLNILDLGCGTGYFSNQLLPFGSVAGLDPEKSAIDIAKKNYPDIKFVVGSGLELPFKDSEFDVVVATEVIEHVPDDMKFLKEINRVLKKGGHLVLTTESLEGLFPITETCHEGGTEYYINYTVGYNKKGLSKKLRSAKFSVKDVSYSLVLLSKLFMELTKFVYIKINPSHQSQTDVHKVKKKPLFKVYSFLFPILLIFNSFDRLCNKWLKGSCIMTFSRKK